MARPRRIAFVSEHASPLELLGGEDAGGQNVYVAETSRQLARLGYAVDVFTRRAAADAPDVVAFAPGVRVVHVPAGPARFVAKDALWPLMPAFRDHLLRFARRGGARYDLLHGHFWMSGWVAAEAGPALGAPVVQLFHALGTTKRRHQGAADTSPPDRIAAERRIARAADRVVAQCPSERDELLADYGAAPERIAVIPAGVDTVRFRPVPQEEARRRLGLGPDDLTIVYVGRLLPRKDIRNIVRALALLRHRADLPVRLFVVGGEGAEPDPLVTPEIGAVQRLAAELGVADRVVCTGKRQPDELRWYYGAGDVAVTTPWYEPFGLTPLEAMACGRPVVGAAVGGIAYTVVDGATGALVPPRDPAALAERLAFLLARPGLRAQLGAAARARVEREFTWVRTAQRTAALYDEVLRERRATSDERRAGAPPVWGVGPLAAAPDEASE
ncbi:MAG TPA: glycosyltransferase [Thermomicrobiales bacterium]|nr:glycosyltransferase [Thermomicrobiales bacterium]